MNDKQPMFSIIMPCYNHGKYVEEAINSVLNQTYQDFELIVGDDGSTDDSWDIIQKYKDRIICFRLEKNDFKKCTEMMMDLSRGKYLAQMASDDVWYEDKLELQLKDIEKNPNGYAYFTWAAFTDENLEITDDSIFCYENRNRYEWVRTSFSHGTVLAINTMITVNDKLKWLDYSQGVLNYRQLPDQMVFLKMLLNKDDVYVTPKIEMKIRRHDNCVGTITRESAVRTINETISIWAEIWERMDDDFFVKAFHNDLFHPQVTNKGEIQCERMLVLLKLALEAPIHQTTALNYFTKHYCDKGISEILLNTYNFTRENFFEISGKTGYGSLHVNLLKKQIFQGYRDMVQSLIKCNERLLKILSFDISKNDIDNVFDGIKDYITLTNQVKGELDLLGKFSEQVWNEFEKELQKEKAAKSINPDTLNLFLNAQLQYLKSLEQSIQE